MHDRKYDYSQFYLDIFVRYWYFLFIHPTISSYFRSWHFYFGIPHGLFWWLFEMTYLTFIQMLRDTRARRTWESNIALYNYIEGWCLTCERNALTEFVSWLNITYKIFERNQLQKDSLSRWILEHSDFEQNHVTFFHSRPYIREFFLIMDLSYSTISDFLQIFGKGKKL